MRARIKVDELPAFDAAPYLDSDEAIAAYLTDILQANDAGLLSAALGDIARARGMTDIAKAAGITREALYKALRPGSAPRFDTVNRVCTALGVRLVVQPFGSGLIAAPPSAVPSRAASTTGANRCGTTRRWPIETRRLNRSSLDT